MANKKIQTSLVVDGTIKSLSSVQVSDDLSIASADKLGAVRYRKDTNGNYIEICMQISAVDYAWILIKEYLFSSYAMNYTGTKYFISSYGNDSNDGLTIDTAWQTLSKVNAQEFSPGDAILFNSTDSFVGSLEISDSGTSGNPITFGAYGDSSYKPKFYGSEIITGWSVYSGSIYEASYSTDLFQVFIDNTRLKMARLGDDYNFVTGVTSQTVFTVDAPSETSDYYVGCTVMIRTANYYVDTRTVIASTGNTITINSAPSSTVVVGVSVVILNKLEFLNSPGEWFYDTSANKIYVWTPDGDSPADHIISGSITAYSDWVSSSNNSYITFSNLNILQQKNAGIRITNNADSIIVDNCIFEGQGNNGIHTELQELSTSGNHSYTNNLFSDVAGNAIYAYRVGNSIISDNIILNTGLVESYGIITPAPYTGPGSAIDCSDPTSIGTNTIEYNFIYNSGYNGIFWRGPAYINHNYIYGSCLVKSDGGGIYTGSAASGGSILSYNIIDYSEGLKLGSSSNRNWGEGIYLDENSIGITVEYNTILNAGEASIYLHKPYNHTVRYNKILSNRYGFWFANTASGASTFTNNLIAMDKAEDIDGYEPGNLLVRASATNTSLDNNIYINPFASRSNAFRKTDGSYTDFSGWQATGQDASSTYISTIFTTNEEHRLVYNNSKAIKTYYLNAATGVKDYLGSTITNSFNLDPFTSRYIRGLNIDCILDYQDSVAPIITDFTIPSTSDSPIVTISSFIATDAIGVTGYKITQSTATPLLTDSGWVDVAPTTYTSGGSDAITLYAWVRDAAGNISNYLSADTIVPSYTGTLTDGLLVAYDFEETSGLLQDLSGNGRNATAHGANITINQSGNPGKAYTFAGTTFSDARISIADNDVLSFTDSMSVFIWLKLTTINKEHALVYKGTGTGPAYEYMIRITSGNKIQYSIFQNGASPILQVTGSTELVADTWYLIECSASDILTRSTMSINVNNVAETLTGGAASSITGVMNGSGLFYIGGESFVGSWLNGQISQLLMYGRVLTTNEKIGLYNGGDGINKADW